VLVLYREFRLCVESSWSECKVDCCSNRVDDMWILGIVKPLYKDTLETEISLLIERYNYIEGRVNCAIYFLSS
jgi:hypothetical protein